MNRAIVAWCLSLLVTTVPLGNEAHGQDLVCTLRYYRIADTNVTTQIRTATQPLHKEWLNLSAKARGMPSGPDQDKVSSQMSSIVDNMREATLSVLDKESPSATHTFTAPTTGKEYKQKTTLAGESLSILVRTRPGVYPDKSTTTLWVEASYAFMFGNNRTSASGVSWGSGHRYILFSGREYLVLEVSINQ